MPLYRYRTATLVGPWRDSLLKAETDAVAVGQAEFAADGRFAWRVHGEIEVSGDLPGGRDVPSGEDMPGGGDLRSGEDMPSGEDVPSGGDDEAE